MAVTRGRPLVFALRALGIGDFLVAVPALRALRRAFPDHELRVSTRAAVTPLAQLVGGIDTVSPARGPDDFAAPGREVDVAVNLHGRGPQSTRALRALKPRRLLAFRGGADVTMREELAAPPWDERWPRHERQRWCALLASFGIPSDADDIWLRRPNIMSAARDAIVIHPGAAFGSRRWPPERFAAVARELATSGCDVVVTGSRAETPLAREVAARADLPETCVLAGDLDVVGLAALIADATLLVCGDTGVAHLASAYGTPSVVLFGPTPPQAWGPPADPIHTVLWPRVCRDEPANPWGSTPDPALLAITVDDVLGAARRLIRAGRMSFLDPAL